jgi:hypothetical protein
MRKPRRGDIRAFHAPKNVAPSGLIASLTIGPWVNTHGYSMPPLRGYATASLRGYVIPGAKCVRSAWLGASTLRPACGRRTLYRNIFGERFSTLRIPTRRTVAQGMTVMA